MKYQSHPYHLVDPSPWPFMVSLGLLVTTIGMVIKMHTVGHSNTSIILGVISVILVMILWWRDTIRESTYQGNHTSLVQRGIKFGFLLFIISEVLFFFSIFWAYFHSSLSPSVELGAVWPPEGIEALNPWGLPLLNTILLLSSGATITWAHHSLISRDRKGVKTGGILTIILALLFTLIQGYEYYEAPFTFADSVYGSTFYLATGTHGVHVIVGTIFLAVSLLRVVTYELTDKHHHGLEFAILYWHFVDVVWLFLFAVVYIG